MITTTGWTWEYIDDCMTLPRLAALSSYWRGCPPTHILVAAYFGIKPEPKNTQTKLPEFLDLPEYE